MKKESNISNDYLSYENTKCIKGLCALGILFHHLFQYGSLFHNGIIAYTLQNMGEWIVALFFFFSGYGLMISYIKKGKDYVWEMPKNRILPFYLTYFIMLIFYYIFYIIIGDYDKVNLFKIIQSLFFGNSIIVFGWYLQTLLIFYIVFYLSFRYINKEKIRKVILILSWFLYCCICIFLKLSITWYVSSLSFIIGIFWASNKIKIDVYLKDNKRFSYVGIGISLFIFIISLVCMKIFRNYIMTLFYILNDVSFSILFIFILYYINKNKIKIIFNNKITNYLGNISHEIYVSQGIFLIMFKDKIPINNSWIYSGLVIICTLLFAKIIHKIFKKINKICKEKNKVITEKEIITKI